MAGIVSTRRAEIDARLAVLLPRAVDGQDGLDLAIRDAVLAPGKRLRPLLCAFVAEDLGGAPAPAIDAGCAVEMVHAASLILDDLPCMDDASLRRGRPATHVGHGEDVAMLAAIAILSGSFEVLAGIGAASAEARLRSVAILSRAVGTAGLVGGQFADLKGGARARPVAEIARANALKTASLFLAAVDMGAVMAGADEMARERLTAFAAELGEAFQLLDDLLDGTESAFLIGKDVGKDREKSTIVSMIGHAGVERRIERHRDSALRILEELLGPRSRLSLLVASIFERRPAAVDASGADERLEQGAGAR
ncbi:geranylgeranyl pyrophosphate synthase [Aurantimonas sp. Leaf443]|nr:geranylgeranyl pyrophosphate synthase [Aurantimonas sp. Leaf443]